MKFRGGFQLSLPRTPREGFRRSMIFALARVEEMSICAILVTFFSKENLGLTDIYIYTFKSSQVFLN